MIALLSRHTFDLTQFREQRTREPMGRTIMMLFMGAVVWGCSTSSHPESEPPPPSPSVPESGVCASKEDRVALEGQWAVRMELEVEGSERPDAWVTLCPENPQVGTAIAWMKLDYASEPKAGETTHNATICALELPIVTASLASCPQDPSTYLEVSITLGDAFRDYLPAVSLPGITYAAIETPQGAFRTSGIDFRGGQLNADDDSDDHPGVTLDFTTGGAAPAIAGSIYTNFELLAELRGQIRNPHCIEGGAQASFDYEVIETDIMLWGETPFSKEEAVKNIPLLRVLDSSTFRALRANGSGSYDFDDDKDGSVSCGEIAAHASLFSR